MFCAEFSPDDRFVLTGSMDKTARLWDVQSGKELRTFNGHTSWIWSAAFSPDGQRVLTACVDGTAKLWDTATGHEVLTFRGHRAGVRGVAFSPDGQRVVTASEDRTARVWETATPAQLSAWLKEENLRPWSIPDSGRLRVREPGCMGISGFAQLCMTAHAAALLDCDQSQGIPECGRATTRPC